MTSAEVVRVIARSMFTMGNRRLGVERNFDDPNVGTVYIEEAKQVVHDLWEAGFAVVSRVADDD